ncbi:unnamed protein product [Ambrosiozyma monospora]|uniref:Unnamed protein product n=1 Tax=Ambrosiozyma monospora TaxID=43982 RepID=A0ACB5TDQ4_AMBMO|nr:unnamed protein product [Ambrosiozyma monospora]
MLFTPLLLALASSASAAYLNTTAPIESSTSSSAGIHEISTTSSEIESSITSSPVSKQARVSTFLATFWTTLEFVGTEIVTYECQETICACGETTSVVPSSVVPVVTSTAPTPIVWTTETDVGTETLTWTCTESVCVCHTATSTVVDTLIPSSITETETSTGSAETKTKTAPTSAQTVVVTPSAKTYTVTPSPYTTTTVATHCQHYICTTETVTIESTPSPETYIETTTVTPPASYTTTTPETFVTTTLPPDVYWTTLSQIGTETVTLSCTETVCACETLKLTTVVPSPPPAVTQSRTVTLVPSD